MKISLSSRAVNAASCRSEPRIASSLLSREFISGRANGRFIQAEATGWQDLQISATSCNSLFSSAGEPSYFQQKLAQLPFYQRLALIARKRPMAVSSKQKQPDGQTSRFQQQVALQFHYYPAQQFISGRAKLFSSKSRPNGRFINARPSGRFNNGFAIFSKSLPNGCFINARPNGRFINARPNGRFIKAEATGWPDLQILAKKLQFCYYSARSIYQRPGQAVFSKSRPNGRCINGRSNGRFINASPNGRFINGPVAFLSTPGPMAVLSTPGRMAVLSRQKQPDGQTSRF